MRYKQKYFIFIFWSLCFISMRLSAQDPLCNALLDAAFKGNYATVEKILKKDVKPDCVSDEGLTPLFYAIDRADEKMVLLLLKHGANINLAAQTEQGETPLIVAVESGNVQIVKLLLNNKAIIDLCNRKGSAVMHYAAFNNDTSILKILIEKGATTDIADYRGITPLMRACWNGSFEAAIMLIEAKADVNKKDLAGFSPLMYASQHGQYDVAILLLENWADLNYISAQNTSALSLAIMSGRPEMVDLFLLNGANPNENYSLSLNPLSLSKMAKFPAIRDTLKKWGSKNNFMPCFAYKYGIGVNIRFNNRDFQIGANVLFKDIKFNLETSIYFSFRPFAIPVLVETGNNSYFQYWERMHTFGFSLGKSFLLSNRENNEYGIFAGVLCEYSFGRYRGTDVPINNGIRLKPALGFEQTFSKNSVRLSAYYGGYTAFGNPKWGIDFTILRNFTRQPAKIVESEL